MNNTKIEWTEKTWNPITGCSAVSLGCKNCYAKKMANRLYAMKNPRYLNNFAVTVHEDLFNQPLKIKKSSFIFVCSMSDLFHESISFEIISQIFDVMKKANWHIFQVLTKRPERLLKFSKNHQIPDNVWIGTSVENDTVLYRVDILRKVNAKVHFLSCEPLLGPLKNLNLYNIEWVVVGGESGSNSRPIKKEWVLDIKDKCKMQNIPFFFKQWGGWNKKKNGSELDGKEYKEMPNNGILKTKE